MGDGLGKLVCCCEHLLFEVQESLGGNKGVSDGEMTAFSGDEGVLETDGLMGGVVSVELGGAACKPLLYLV